MATILDKQLKGQITVDGVDYTIAVDPEGIRLIGKGKRRPDVELRWRDLLSGEAALAVALNASLSTKRQASAKPATDTLSLERASRQQRSEFRSDSGWGQNMAVMVRSWRTPPDGLERRFWVALPEG